ncbi:hypothetical protein RJ640_014682 [Escallonia rubra]|uniref:Uncharacterized protein n=1 Tax=Escallonia rubra TaxID=112253 RepID=A0AA88RVN4_9ASTE|nr:hypothetical protein RJ640_014682 [Escallonia rubra]
MATDSSIVIPFLANIRSMPSTPMFAGGREASASLLLGAAEESLRPNGTSIRGPPDAATASRAANMRMSAQETCSGHAASTIDFIRDLLKKKQIDSMDTG